MVILTNIPFVPDSTLPYGIEFYIYSQSPKTGGAASNVIYWDPNLHFVEFFHSIKNNYHFDALFIHLAELSEIPLGLEHFPLPIIASISDWNLYYFKLKHTLAYFDLILCDLRGVKILTHLGYNAKYWNFYGYIPSRFSPPPEEKTYDIVFAGNLNTYFQRDRASWLTRLARLSHKYKVKIDTCVFGHEYTKLLQSAKIVFNRSIRGEANMRVFEALAADALILLEEENQEIQSYFKNNNECILYNNQNFEAIIDSLLQNPNKLTEIIQNASAHKHICTKHYSLHELKNIIGKHIQNSNWKQRQSIQYTSQQHIDATLIARILSTHRFSKKEDDPTAIKELLATTPNSPLLLWYYALLAAKVPDNEKQAFYKISLNTYYSQCEFLSTTCLFWTHFNFLLILQRLNFCPDRRLQLLKTLHQLLDTNSTTLFSQDISLPACISEEPFMMEINYYSWPLHEAPFANDFGVSLSGILMHWVTFNLGKEYLMQDQLQLAERYFGRANNYFSNNSECQFLLAYTQNQQKKWPSAQIHIQNAWELDPLNHHYWPLLKKLMSSTNSDNWNNQNTIFALLQEVSKKMWQ